MNRLLTLTLSYLARSRGHLLYASIGLIAGTATLVFFLGLSAGIRDKVLNRLYPVNQVEFQPEKVRMFGMGLEVPARLDEPVLAAIAARDDVAGVYPKQRSLFQARLWGGGDILGAPVRVEAFFDGIEPALISQELQESERSVLGSETTETNCSSDVACGPGAFCKAGVCGRMTWYDRFRETGTPVVCSGDGRCPPDWRCDGSVCRKGCGGDGDCGPGGTCRSGVCRLSCGSGAADCGPGRFCDDGVCAELACELASPQVQLADDPVAIRGRLVGGVAGAGAESTAPGGVAGTCPAGTYCAASSLASTRGFCSVPIPVLLSPFLLDVYNDVAATALGMRRLSGLEVALGINFAIMYGESYFAADAPVSDRVVRRCQVVGFTSKALDFGITMPLGDVVSANAMLRGSEQAAQYSSVIVRAGRNEEVPALVEDMKVLGLVLAPRSEAGRKAANVLLVLTMVFVGVSLIILLISSINIAHTFLMLVSERRREIAIYRSVGASARHIRLIISGEALMLGLVGGMVGDLAGWLASRLANVAAGPLFDRIPGSPSDLFSFSPGIFAFCLACAVLFSLIGAHGPSRRAAMTDPAHVLAQD